MNIKLKSLPPNCNLQECAAITSKEYKLRWTVVSQNIYKNLNAYSVFHGREVIHNIINRVIMGNASRQMFRRLK